MSHELRHRRRSSQRGVSLIELLVVVAIIGLIVGMVGVQVSAYNQRARLEGAAIELRDFLLSAQALAMNTNGRVTVTVRQAGTSWVVELTPASPPRPGTAGAVFRTRMELPPEIIVHGLGTTAIDWPENPTGSGRYELVCDTRARALDPTGTNQPIITSARTLRLTHRSMLDGRLKGPRVFELQISPLWNVIQTRRLR